MVKKDPALTITPPESLEAGYVPIVIRQEIKQQSLISAFREISRPGEKTRVAKKG